MKLSNNILPLDNFLKKSPKTEQRIDPKIQSGSQVTLCPSLLNKTEKLSDEERKSLFERLKYPNPIDRNVT